MCAVHQTTELKFFFNQTLPEQIQLYYWTEAYDTFSAGYQVTAKYVLHMPYIYSIFQILVSFLKIMNEKRV